MSNPRRKSRRNPGEVLIVANPRRSHRRRKNYTRRHKAQYFHKRNPRRGFRRRHHSSRNPNIAGFSTKELLNLTLGAGAGVVGSKYITAIALGDNNQGWMGYAGTAVVVLGLGWVAHKFVGKDAATGVVAGGLGALALRIFQENVSGTSAAAQVSGLGDPDMTALGVGLREYRPASLPYPAGFGPTAAALAAAAAPSPAKGRARMRG